MNNEDNIKKVKGNVENFIGIYENAYSEDYCDRVIEFFEIAHKNKLTFSRQQGEGVSETVKKDQSLWSGTSYLSDEAYGKLIGGEFLETFEPVLNSYIQRFSVLEHNPVHVWGNKIQRTKIGGGYHVWHFESGGLSFCRRVLAYTMYLNDVEEGGETEFLYQATRVKPKKGTLAIFPAAFTHTHRGNPPLSNTKYIATGWVEY